MSPRYFLTGILPAFFILSSVLFACGCAAQENGGIEPFEPAAGYPWMSEYDISQSICHRIEPPAGFSRPEAAPGSFAEWLRFLPLKEGRPPVTLYNGATKPGRVSHVAVIDIDAGKSNLQQCADAVIRLRAEYLFSVGRYRDIVFNFTSGDAAEYLKWAEGYRPVVRGNSVKWEKSARADRSYAAFRGGYLDTLFMYAGTASLEKELEDGRPGELEAGDVFIQGGFPGHAAIVVDTAENRSTGGKVFLLAQGFMPAQDVHILKNPANINVSPWYSADIGETLQTPDWTFMAGDLKTFAE